MGTKTFRVSGFSCQDCAERVQGVVCQLEGISACQVDYATGRLTVDLDEPEAAEAQIRRAVQTAGYDLLSERPEAALRTSGSQTGGALGFLRFVLSRHATALPAVAAVLTLLGLALLIPATPPWAAMACFGAAILVGGLPLVRFAWQEVWRAHSLGINTLMVIAVTGAVAIGEWAEAAIVVVLFALGEALEGYAADRSRRALQSLLELAPPVALRKTDSGATEEVAVEELVVGDRIVVRAGDRVPADGVVRMGTSGLDQAAITGESMPVEKQPGDEVFAGTISLTGVLEIEVTRLAADSTLSRMIHMVEEAQARRPEVQRFIDRFARIYTPTVAVVALLVAAVPPLAFGQPFRGEQGWLMRALQMLVIACPCALVISTPVSLVSAMTNAAQRGVLIKGGRFLERLSRATTFAFDKTGTLTEGRPAATDIVDVCTCGECLEDCGLRHAAALESQSSHPLAHAVLDEARQRGLLVPGAQDVTVLGGRGLTGTVNGQAVTVASHAHFDEYLPHEEGVCQMADQLAAQGKTVIMVQHDDELCGLFAVADQPRPSSQPAIADLLAMGMDTVMLTGDHRLVAEEIGRQVGISDVRAELLPEQKVAVVSELTQGREGVVMVGDGVNDAPALASAHVGIAMGGAGSAQAMETADVVLMGDDLRQLPFLVRLSRATWRTIRINIGLALAVKFAVFVLAAAGLATLWMAIAADVGASLVVILHGMRLRSFADQPTARRTQDVG